MRTDSLSLKISLKDFTTGRSGRPGRAGGLSTLKCLSFSRIRFMQRQVREGSGKRSINGITFTPVFDHENSIAIGDIATAPSDPDIVWVGTGEANGDYWGDGMYKSTDGGTTWTNMGLRGSSRIGRIRIHPGNPDIVYVAATGRFNSQNPERGVFKTTDGGETWSKSLEVIENNRYIGVIDLVMDPRDPGVLYAASYDRPGGGRHNDDYEWKWQWYL